VTVALAITAADVADALTIAWAALRGCCGRRSGRLGGHRRRG
jgi:hypothetical protein